MRQLLKFLFAIVLGCGVANAAISVIQTKGCVVPNTCGNSCTANCTFTSNVAAHNMIVVAYDGPHNMTVSASDTSANTYQQESDTFWGGSGCCGLYGFITGMGTNSGSLTVTLSPIACTSPFTTGCGFVMWELSIGGDETFIKGSPTGNTCIADDGLGTVTSLSCNVNAVTGNVLLGIYFIGASPAPGSGYTQNSILTSTTNPVEIEYKTAASTGALAVNITGGSSNAALLGFAIPFTPVATHFRSRGEVF